MSDYLDVAAEAAERAGEIQAEAFREAQEVEYKGPRDIVTGIDRRCEEAIRERIWDAFPDHAILSEEAGEAGDSAYRWIVDPLDGTTNFVHGFPHFCVSIALEVEGDFRYGAVYDTPTGDLYTARRGGGASVNGEPLSTSDTGSLRESLIAVDFSGGPVDDALRLVERIESRTRGFRRTGSAVTHLFMLADGTVDGVVGTNYAPWDIAAGVVLTEAAGGTITALDGGPDYGADLIASNGGIHGELVEHMAG